MNLDTWNMSVAAPRVGVHSSVSELRSAVSRSYQPMLGPWSRMCGKHRLPCSSVCLLAKNCAGIVYRDAPLPPISPIGRVILL
jgi:hypothetical protein